MMDETVEKGPYQYYILHAFLLICCMNGSGLGFGRKRIRRSTGVFIPNARSIFLFLNKFITFSARVISGACFSRNSS